MKFKDVINREYAEEYANYYAKQLKKSLTILVAGIIGMFALYDFAELRGKPFTIVSWISIIVTVIGAIAIIVIAVNRIKAYRKKIIEAVLGQIDTSYHRDEISFDCEIKEDTIYIYTPETVKKYELKYVIKVDETENYFVIMLKGNFMIPVTKSSIEGATEEEFKNELLKYEETK